MSNILFDFYLRLQSGAPTVSSSKTFLSSEGIGKIFVLILIEVILIQVGPVILL
jgi:hypothetical protein